MNLALSIAAFLPGILSGILLILLLWGQEQPTAMSVLLMLSLGAGIGVGLTSVLYFFYLLAFAGTHLFIFVQVAVLGLLVWLFLHRRRRLPRIAFPKWDLQPWQLVLALCVVALILLVVLGLSHIWSRDLYGAWDAFMIYNRTARFIFRGGTDWVQAFSPQTWWSFHADYPLLVPLNVAQAWELAGNDTQTAPKVLSALFMLACAGIFVAGLARLKSTWQAAVGLIILLNTQNFIRGGLAQTADMPLAFYMLCTVVLFFLYSSSPEPAFLVLAGLTTGLAAWTKNEGELFAATATAGFLIGFVRPGKWSRLGWFLAGLAAPLVAVLTFKLFLAPPNDLLGVSPWSLFQQVAEWPRHLAILQAVYAQLKSGGIILSVVYILIAYALVFGIAPQLRLQSAFVAVLTMAVLQALGYYIIYLITPHPIQWQLDSSLPRILYQLYVPLLFAFFVFVADVQTALGFTGKLEAAEQTA